MRTRGLPRMHSTGENYHFLVLIKSQWSFCWIILCLWIQTTLVIRPITWYAFSLICNSVFRWNCHHFHFSTFNRIINSLSMEIQIFVRSCIGKLLLNLIYFGLWLLIAKWVWESKKCGLIWLIAKHMLESQNKLLIVVHEIVYFGEYTTPFLLCVW